MYKEIINKYSELLLDDKLDATFEEKNLVLFSFVGTIFFLISIIVNFFAQNNFYINLAGILSFFGMMGIYFFIRVNRKYLLSLYLMVFITLLSSFLAWYFFNGLFGSFAMILLLTTVFYALIARGLHRYIVLILQLFFLVVLGWIEFENPDVVVKYPDTTAAFFDIFLTLFFGIIFLFIAFRYIIERYLRHETIARTVRILEKKNSEIIEKNKELDELNKMKDKFFSIISHDLKNPLSALSNMAKFLKSSHSKISEVETREMIGQIYDSSQGLLNLTEQLLTWAKIQSGKITVNKENFSLNALANMVINSLSLLIQNKNLTLSVNIPDNLNLFADMNMVSTILRNLLTNAIKFSHRNGKIDLIVETNETETIVKVVDYGMGMNEETRDNLFKISNAKSTEGSEGEKGTGLGLILCKEFAEANGGNIWVESQLGIGSIFTFTIPR